MVCDYCGRQSSKRLTCDGCGAPTLASVYSVEAAVKTLYGNLVINERTRTFVLNSITEPSVFWRYLKKL